MSWRAITEADLLQCISGAELETLRETLLADGQADPVASQITLTVNLVRGYIAACDRNTLGAAGTLPDGLVLPACQIIVVDLNTRAGGVLVDDSGQRAKAKDAALAMLSRDVATCKFAVEDPDSAVQPAAPRPAIDVPTRNWSAANQDGI
jgi:hypothetical protein